MKRTCNGCRAVRGLYLTLGQSCELGFNTKFKESSACGSNFYEMVPLEECPKPKTNKDYVNRSLRKDRLKRIEP